MYPLSYIPSKPEGKYVFVLLNKRKVDRKLFPEFLSDLNWASGNHASLKGFGSVRSEKDEAKPTRLADTRFQRHGRASLYVKTYIDFVAFP